MSTSILSNLDLENLLNSAITLIHQNFKYSQISIYLLQEDIKTINRYMLSNKGLELITNYHYKSDSDAVSWVLTHKEILVINDFQSKEDTSRSPTDPDIKSELVVPLKSGNQFLGVLDLCSNSIDEFSPSVVETIQVLADNIALGLRNAKIFTFEEIKKQATQRFTEIITDLSVETSQEELISRILIELGKVIPYAAAAVWLFENSTSDLGLEQFTSPTRLVGINLSDHSTNLDDRTPEDVIEQARSVLLQLENDSKGLISLFPWLADITEQNKPIFRDFNAIQEPLGQAVAISTPYSALGIPLNIKDKNLGFIILIHNIPGHYNVDFQAIASTISLYIALAIENARNLTASHEESWMAAVLSQVTRISQSNSTVAELLESISHLLVELAGVNACSLYLWDDQTKAFYHHTSYGFDEEQQSRLDAWGMISDSLPAYNELITVNKPVILNAHTLTGEIIELIFPDFDFQANLLVLFPMNYRNRTMGTALIDFSGSRLDQQSTQKIWDDMFSVIQEILQNAAGMIENLLRLKSSEEEAYISIALLQVAQAVVSLNELNKILDLIVRITPILVGVKRCAIYLWNPTHQVFRLSQNYGFSKSDLLYEYDQIRADEFPLLGFIYDLNRVAYHNITANDTPKSWNEIALTDLHFIDNVSLVADEQSEIKLDPTALQANTRLLIGFPLSVKGEVLGVMVIEEDELIKGSLSSHIREKRIEIVNGITHQTAVAIKNEYLQQENVNSERMERELQLARDIQKAFLPHHLPEVPGWDLDVRWQPAREVGGDFYDVLLNESNKLGFVIADVADKGMPAALFMTLIRTLIRAAAREYSSPAEVLRQVNELLLEDARNGMFVTVFYCVINLDDGKIIYANAGHNPPVVKRALSDEIIELTRTTMALGIFSDIEVDERELTLVPGDGIVLYTDGVTEAFSPTEEMFSSQKLLGMIQQLPFHTSTGLLDVIEKELYDFIGSAELSDDLTLAAIKFRDKL